MNIDIEYKKITESLFYKTRKLGMEDKEKQVLIGVLVVAWGNYHYAGHNSIELSEMNVEKVIRTLEENNKKLKGFFNTLVIYNAKDKRSELQLIEEIFKELNNINYLSADSICEIINNVVLSVDNSRNVDDHITPMPIQELFIKNIGFENNMKIGNYFSGFGSTLLRVGKDYESLGIELYGEEKDVEAYLISQILLLVNEIENYTIENKDTYDFRNAKEKEFDYVLVDGPFSLNLKSTFEDNRVLSYGIPNKTRVDWASYQLGIYSLKDTGKAIVTGPMSVLDRLSDKDIRKKIVEEDIIEAVVKLPSRLYASTNIPVAIIIFNKNKHINNTNKIIFIDASDEYTSKSRCQNSMTSESIDKICSCINFNQEIEGFSMIVHYNDISKHDFNLNPNVYFNEKVIRENLGRARILGDIAKITTGVQISDKEIESLKRNPTHYYLNIKNIENNGIIYDEEYKIRDKNIAWHDKYSIEAGDIIMTTKGTTNKMLVVPEDFKNSFISNNLTIIRVDKSKYDPYVLLKYLKSDVGNLVLENATSGISMRVIAASKLENIEVPDYELSFMKSMGERIKKNERNYRAKLAELEDSFDKEDERIMRTLEVERGKNNMQVFDKLMGKRLFMYRDGE